VIERAGFRKGTCHFLFSHVLNGACLFLDKKRHHYVPNAYLRAFCDDSGKVLVYRKDNPSKAIPSSPNNTAFHKYYYSQPSPDCGKDHNALEDCFSVVETNWPTIVERIHRWESVNDSLLEIFGFIAMQRARACKS
jgi:hypothetical protein